MLNLIFDLAARGFVVTNAYADGIVRMAKVVPGIYRDTEQYCFIWANGRGANDFHIRSMPHSESIMSEDEMDDADHWDMLNRI